jgi:hypothetical protein
MFKELKLKDRINALFKTTKKDVLEKKAVLDEAIKEKNNVEQQIIITNKQLENLRKNLNKIQVKLSNEKTTNIFLTIIEKPRDPRSMLTKTYDWVVGKDSRMKVSGHIFYINKAMDLKIYDIMSDKPSDLFKIKRGDGGEAYMMDKYFARFDNKPVFLVKFPHAITLEIYQEKYKITGEDANAVADGQSDVMLAYDSVAFYNIIEHVIKRRITHGEEPNDIGKFIQQYWMYILLGIGVVILLFTPQGKAMVQNFIKGFKV